MEYSQPGPWYNRYQRGYYDSGADSGLQPLNGYQFQRSGPCGRSYPDEDPHILDGFERYKENPQRYSRYNHWPQERSVRASYYSYPNYHSTRETRREQIARHDFSGRQAWVDSCSEFPDHPHQRAHWGPRMQFRPRPRSARYRRTDSQMSEQNAQDGWTRPQTQASNHRQQDFGLGRVPKLETWLFNTDAEPRYQPNEAYGTYGSQSAHEQNQFYPDTNQQADHWRRFWPGDYHGRRMFDESSPSRVHRGRSGFYKNPHEVLGNTAREDDFHRYQGIRVKNHRATGQRHSIHSRMTLNPECKKWYQNPGHTHPSHKGCAMHTKSSDLHRVPTPCVGNAQLRTPLAQQFHARFESFDKEHPNNSPGCSNADAAVSPPGSPIPPPCDEATAFESSGVGANFEQSRRRSDLSNGIGCGQNCCSPKDPCDKEAAHHGLPSRSRSHSRRYRQELRRRALAAIVLRIERIQLRREWEKLRREQDALLRGQRRLHYEWQNLEEERHRRSFHDDCESLFSGNETENSEADCEEPPPRGPERSRHEGWDAGCGQPSRAFWQTNEEPSVLLDNYNRQWNAVLSGTSSEIPWPTADLKAAMLSRSQSRVSREFDDDAPKLMMWNAFNFFACAFGVRANFKNSNSNMILNISNTPLELTKAIRKQATEDLKRWHQDKLACRSPELAGDESAKGVFAAVHRLYEICTERMKLL